MLDRAKGLRDGGAPSRLRLDSTTGRALKTRMLEAQRRAKEAPAGQGTSVDGGGVRGGGDDEMASGSAEFSKQRERADDYVQRRVGQIARTPISEIKVRDI